MRLALASLKGLGVGRKDVEMFDLDQLTEADEAGVLEQAVPALTTRPWHVQAGADSDGTDPYHVLIAQAMHVLTGVELDMPNVLSIKRQTDSPLTWVITHQMIPALVQSGMVNGLRVPMQVEMTQILGIEPAMAARRLDDSLAAVGRLIARQLIDSVGDTGYGKAVLLNPQGSHQFEAGDTIQTILDVDTSQWAQDGWPLKNVDKVKRFYGALAASLATT